MLPWDGRRVHVVVLAVRRKGELWSTFACAKTAVEKLPPGCRAKALPIIFAKASPFSLLCAFQHYQQPCSAAAMLVPMSSTGANTSIAV